MQNRKKMGSFAKIDKNFRQTDMNALTKMDLYG